MAPTRMPWARRCFCRRLKRRVGCLATIADLVREVPCDRIVRPGRFNRVRIG